MRFEKRYPQLFNLISALLIFPILSGCMVHEMKLCPGEVTSTPIMDGAYTFEFDDPSEDRSGRDPSVAFFFSIKPNNGKLIYDPNQATAAGLDGKIIKVFDTKDQNSRPFIIDNGEPHRLLFYGHPQNWTLNLGSVSVGNTLVQLPRIPLCMRQYYDYDPSKRLGTCDNAASFDTPSDTFRKILINGSAYHLKVSAVNNDDETFEVRIIMTPEYKKNMLYKASSATLHIGSNKIIGANSVSKVGAGAKSIAKEEAFHIEDANTYFLSFDVPRMSDMVIDFGSLSVDGTSIPLPRIKVCNKLDHVGLPIPH